MQSVTQSPANGAASDLVIVSAFARGDGLARELAAKGWNVTLIDATAALANDATPEDLEGPFGLLHANDLSEAQISAFRDGGETVAVPGGFALWTTAGPIEGAGDLTPHHLARFPQSVASYLANDVAGNSIGGARRALAKLPFRETWLANFAHQIASPIWAEDQDALGLSSRSPLLSALTLRRPSRASANEALRAAGVTVIEGAVEDLRLEGKGLTALEVAGKVVTGRTFAWLLASSETAAAVAAKLFPRGALTPAWVWVRYRAGLTEGSIAIDQLPHFAAVIEDPFLPWTHANLVVLRRAPVGDARAVDAWVKLPADVLSKTDYLDNIKTKIEALLEARFPRTQARIAQAPRASRFVLHEAEKRAALTTLRAPNLFFASPEQAESLDALGLARESQKLVAPLEKLRNAWLLADQKRAQKEARREASRGGPPT